MCVRGDLYGINVALESVLWPSDQEVHSAEGSRAMGIIQ